MTQSCKICSHVSRSDIDREITKGGSLAKIARLFGVEYDSLYRHAQNHMAKNLVKNSEGKYEITHDLDLLSEIDHLLKKSREIFDRNLFAGNDTTALKALSESRSTLDLLAKISYSLHQVKLLELEQLKIQNGEDEESAKLIVQEGLTALTDEELAEYKRLQDKILAAGKKWMAEYIANN
jgi:hypothetical protein